MNSLYILLLLSLSYMTAFSQDFENKKGKEPILQGNTELVESFIPNATTGNNIRNTYTHDSNGNLLAILREEWQNGQVRIVINSTANEMVTLQVYSILGVLVYQFEPINLSEAQTD